MCLITKLKISLLYVEDFSETDFEPDIDSNLVEVGLNLGILFTPWRLLKVDDNLWRKTEIYYFLLDISILLQPKFRLETYNLVGV